MGIARRTFLGAVAAVPLLATLAASEPGELRERRSIKYLDDDDDDLLALKEGLRRMRARGDSLSLARQIALHARHGRHGDWLFLPWHRLELLAFEATVARVTDHAGFALPYWDYLSTYNIPDYFFDPADPLYCAGRKATADTDVADERWAMNRGKAQFRADSFATFSGAPGKAGTLEAFGHNLVHAIVGGDMGRLDTSPNDPLFFLHHCNMDRAWATWTASNPDGPYPDAWRRSRLQGFVHPSRSLNGTRAGETLDCEALGYRYDSLFDPVAVASPPPPPQEFRFPREPLPPPPPPLAALREFRTRAMAGDDPSQLVIDLPDAIMAPVRAGSPLHLSATGSVGFGAPALAGGLIRLDGLRRTAAGTLVDPIAAVPVIEFGGHHHRPGHGGGYSFLFDESERLQELIRAGTGPIRLTVSVTDFATGERRAAARAEAFELAITLTPRG